MSRKKDNRKPKTREPWEQSIYEPDTNSSGSRLEKRQSKKGHTTFLKILVFLLVCIIVIPSVTVWYILHERSNTNAAKDSQPSSSVVKSSSKESSASSSSTVSSESSVSESSSSSSSSEAEVTPESSVQTEDPNQQQATEPAYDYVLSGEGLKQVAARNGITIDQLLQLNPNVDVNTMLYPGDTLRVK